MTVINLLIDSVDRQFTDDDTHDFTVSLAQGFSIRQARLKSCCVPLTWYNITDSNNTISFSLDTTDNGLEQHTITISTGFYTSDLLITTLTAAFVAVNTNNAGTVELVYDNTAPAGKNLSIQLTPGARLKPTGTGTPVLILWNNPLPRYLGFADDDNESDGPDITAVNVPQWYNTDYLKLCITYLDGEYRSINNRHNGMSFLLELDVDDKQVYWGRKMMIKSGSRQEDGGGKQLVYHTPIRLQQFRVRILDRNEQAVDLNGADWWALIELEVDDC